MDPVYSGHCGILSISVAVDKCVVPWKNAPLYNVKEYRDVYYD